MTTTIHRQWGKLGKRSADEATVAMLIKEVNDADILLGKLAEHTKTWRDSWSDIFFSQITFTDSFHDIYKPFPLPQDYENQPAETPVAILRKIAKLHAAQNDLKADMAEEIERVDKMIIEPLSEAKAALKPIKKAIDKRENKKLDYERFSKAAESQRAKRSKSDKDYSTLSKAELDLEKAMNAYDNADNHLKSWIPEIMNKITEFLPHIAESLIQTQYTFLSNTYTAIYEFASQHNLSDPEGEVVIAEWEELFLPVQRQVESEITFIARGKAITAPMNQVVQEKSYVSSIPKIARGKKPPPPPPPAGPPGAGAAGNGLEKSAFGKSAPRNFSGSREKSEPLPSPPLPKSARSTIGNSRGPSASYEREESPPSASSKPRPAIGSVRSRVSSSNISARVESPPPPLPCPRPGQPGSRQSASGDIHQGDFRSILKSRSATPLIDTSQDSLTPSQRAGLTRIRSAGPNSTQPNDRLLSAVSSSPFRTSQAKIERSLSAGASEFPNSRPVVSRSPTASIASYKTAVSDSPSLSSIAGKKKPPPPPPKKKGLGRNEIWVQALFPFEGQDVGDLSFNEGDKIKVLKKTESTDDWWEGEVNGRKGQFPANYTEVITA